MQVEYCNIVWSITESIQYYYQCLLLYYIPVLSTKSLNDWGHSCSPNIWLHPSTSFGHFKPMIENVVYKCGSYLIRNTHMSSASSASSSVLPPNSSATQPHSSSSSSSLWLFFSPRPIPGPSIVRHCNIVLCSGYIYTYQLMVHEMHLG